MSHPIPRNPLCFFAGFWSAEFTIRHGLAVGKLNPLHVAIAKRAYHVHSDVLGVPDRLGLFSSGPPTLQAGQGYRFGSLMYAHVASVCITAPLLLVFKLAIDQFSVVEHVAIVGLCLLPFWAIYFLFEIYDPNVHQTTTGV